MKYAIIKSGSSQLKISEGDKIKVLGHTDKPIFEVLFFNDGSKIFTGKDDLKNVKVAFSILGTGKSRKINVGRFKAKSRYDKTRGFREQFTEVNITNISFGDEKKESVKKAVVKKTVTKKVVVKKAKEKTKVK